MNLGLDRVFGPAHVVPLVDSTIGNDLHTGADVALDVLAVCLGLWPQETSGGSRVEPAHLHL